MLPDLPMPSATDPSTACGTPIRQQVPAVDYAVNDVFELSRSLQ